MQRDDVIATLRGPERESKDLGVRRLAVFGSVARGDDSGSSDVDPVVAFEEGQRHALVDAARGHVTNESGRLSGHSQEG